MDAVKSFNEELSGIYEAKPPISRAKMTLLTKKAIKGIKFYKHIVQSMEKFVQKCRPEYKVPGLYVVDSVVRQSRHQFGPEKDVFMPRLCKNIINTFQHIYKCPNEDKPRILRVLNLWQKNNVFPPEVVQQLMVMGGAPTPEGSNMEDNEGPSSSLDMKSEGADGPNLTNLLANLLANPDAGQINNLAGLLSSSQHNQLQGLLKQVKGSEEWNLLELEDGEVYERSDSYKKVPQSNNNNVGSGIKREESSNIFQPSDSSRQLPFLHSNQVPERNHQPSFNRAVLDFDYSDDEQTPPNSNNHQPHPHIPGFGQLPKSDIKPSLLSKLPTPDQIQKLTGMAPEGFDRMKMLEEEQEIFNKQIQQLSSNSLDQKKGESGRKKRSRSRSRSHDRHRHHRSSHRSHSREKGHHRSRRSRSRDRSRRSRRSRSHERRKEKNGLPPLKEGCISVCTTTLWIGNISAKVMQHELQNLVEEFGAVETLNMIPPRGCAYVCMKNRLEAAKALHKIRHYRLGGKSLKCDWAPSKGMPEKEKATWVKEHGVNYVPLEDQPMQIRQLTMWGYIDEESLPLDKKGELQAIMGEKEGKKPEDNVMLDQPVPMGGAPMISGGMPFNPAMPHMMPQNVAMVSRPQMMIRPGFQVQGISPFGAMGFRPQQIPQGITPDPKPKEGNSTPTNDEQSDDARPPVGIPQSPFQAQPQFGAVSMAQRFPGPMPMQIRMMPQQMMAPPQRMGVMPLRMGIPMQLRPGFHPQLQARMPMQGQAHMVSGAMPSTIPMHQLQQQPLRPPPQLGGFPIQMQRFAQPAISEAIPSDIANERDIEASVRGIERTLSHSPGRQNGPPPVSINRQMSNERRNSLDKPPMSADGEKSHMDFNKMRPPHEMRGDRPPPRGFNDRPPMRGFGNRPPREFGDRPPAQGDRNGNSPPQMGQDRGPPRNNEGPPSRENRPGRDFDGGRGFNRDRPPRDFDRPPRDFDRRPSDLDRPRGGRDFDRPPRNFDRDRDSERKRERDRDGDRKGDDRRDTDRKRDRSRSRDRDRGRDRDRDRDRRDDRSGRDDRRDRGPPGRFGGRDRRGGFGGGGFRGRGRGGGGPGRGFNRDRSPEVDPEEEEYIRKRKETLRKRHEEEDQYVTEEIDFTQFGLPAGFGGPMVFNSEESAANEAKEKKEDEESNKRRKWLDEQKRSRRSRDRSPRKDRDRDRNRDRDRSRDKDRKESSPKSSASPNEEVKTEDKNKDNEIKDESVEVAGTENKSPHNEETNEEKSNESQSPNIDNVVEKPDNGKSSNTYEMDEKSDKNDNQSENENKVTEMIPEDFSPKSEQSLEPLTSDVNIEAPPAELSPTKSSPTSFSPKSEQSETEPDPTCTIEKVEDNNDDNLKAPCETETNQPMQYSTYSPGTPTYDEDFKNEPKSPDLEENQKFLSVSEVNDVSKSPENIDSLVSENNENLLDAQTE